MINLLPQETKKSIRAGRLNVVLLRYVIYLAICLIAAVLIFGVGYYITTQERKDHEAQRATYESSNAGYAKIKQESDAFSKDLTIADSILSSEIVFSELIVDIAKTLPDGTVLTSLNITTESAGEPLAINARTKDPEGALRLKAALESSPIFENVSVLSITSPSDASPTTALSYIAQNYPYSVVLSSTLSKGGAR